jgi:hypothetical protein
MAVLLAALSLGGCRGTAQPIGIPLRERSRFESEWRSYLQLEPEKALAVAGDVEGVHVTGFAFGMTSRDEAEREALRACAERRADRRLAAGCRLYAVGDERVALDE